MAGTASKNPDSSMSDGVTLFMQTTTLRELSADKF